MVTMQSQSGVKAVPEPLCVEDFNLKRCRMITSFDARVDRGGPVVYWMSRDNRVQDNWAMIYAQKLAIKLSVPLVVCFCLLPKFLDATIRQYRFLLKGLQEVHMDLTKLKIPFNLLTGAPKEQIPVLVSSVSASAAVCDFSPLRVPLGWVEDVGKEINAAGVPLVQVDAHNVIPCWVASEKLEYSARTIRGKIHSKLSEYLVDFSTIDEHPIPARENLFMKIDWNKAESSLDVCQSVKEVSWAAPGTKAGLQMLEDFCKKRLKNYHSQSNDPNADALSNLSPWLHFGQVSSQRAILRVKKVSAMKSSVDAFVEQILVRKELADNFCFYNASYDDITGAPSWAQETLWKHSSDKRQYLYSDLELENAETHDDLWNAAQVQMVNEGKMHGFLRMYWAKKILEWTSSPKEALRICIWLNDKYELDGRDPNGYVGCMWSVCGVHDQGWAERPVFGKIRYMNYQGCKRKFDVNAFVRKHGSRKRRYQHE